MQRVQITHPETHSKQMAEHGLELRSLGLPTACVYLMLTRDYYLYMGTPREGGNGKYRGDNKSQNVVVKINHYW